MKKRPSNTLENRLIELRDILRNHESFERNWALYLGSGVSFNEIQLTTLGAVLDPDEGFNKTPPYEEPVLVKTEKLEYVIEMGRIGSLMYYLQKILLQITDTNVLEALQYLLENDSLPPESHFSQNATGGFDEPK